MNVLVTGGAGFIGSQFVRLLLNGESGFENLKKVTVVDSITYSGNLNNLSSVSQDSRLKVEVNTINNPEFLKEFFVGQDYVFNFAAESHVDRSITDAGSFMDTNIIGAYNVFNSSLITAVSRVIHISTDEVYGSLVEGSASEDLILKPNSPYAASKAASDLIARSFYQTHKLPIIVTRCSNNYGPYQYPEKLIPLFILNASQNKPVPVYGDGMNVRDWIHVEDHAEALIRVLIDGTPGEIYNVGASTELPNMEITRLILKHTGKDESLIRYVEDRLGHDRRYAIDSSKIQNQLGWMPTKKFDDGLKETVDWYMSHPNWVKRLQERLLEMNETQEAKA